MASAAAVAAPEAPKLFSALQDRSLAKHVQLYGERLLRFDAIRASKLLEMAQYAVLGFWFNIIIGGVLDKLFPAYDPDKAFAWVCIEITLQIMALTVFNYYSRKLLSVVPFMFSLTDKYVPNLKGEMGIGMAAAPLALLATQSNLLDKVRYLQCKLTGAPVPPRRDGANKSR